VVGEFGLPHITVSLNGEIFEMLWDTGNMSGLAISSQVAKRLNLPLVGQTELYDSGGKTVGKRRIFGLGRFTLFGTEWSSQRAYELVNTTLLGLIGPRYVKKGRFTIDDKNHLIAVSESPLPKSITEGTILPLIPSPQLPAMIVIRGSVNGREVLVQVDTGKTRTCVDPVLATELALPEVRRGFRIDQIELGPYSFDVPSAKEKGFQGISRGLPEPILVGIGADILAQIILTVDYSQKVLVINKN